MKNLRPTEQSKPHIQIQVEHLKLVKMSVRKDSYFKIVNHYFIKHCRCFLCPFVLSNWAICLSVEVLVFDWLFQTDNTKNVWQINPCTLLYTFAMAFVHGEYCLLVRVYAFQTAEQCLIGESGPSHSDGLWPMALWGLSAMGSLGLPSLGHFLSPDNRSKFTSSGEEMKRGSAHYLALPCGSSWYGNSLKMIATSFSDLALCQIHS